MEIVNVLEDIPKKLSKIDYKKIAIPIIIVIFGLVLIFKKSVPIQNEDDKFGSSQSIKEDNNIDDIKSSINNLKQERETDISSIQYSVADIISNERTFTNEKIQSLQNQLESYQQSQTSNLDNLYSKLTGDMMIKATNPIYNEPKNISNEKINVTKTQEIKRVEPTIQQQNKPVYQMNKQELITKVEADKKIEPSTQLTTRQKIINKTAENRLKRIG